VQKLKLSVVVTTYGREANLFRLIESFRDSCREIELEMVVVSSDLPQSEKILGLESYDFVKVICLGDRGAGQPRKRSLYFYENLGIQEATGDWVLITNDDTWLSGDFEKAFIEQSNSADVLVLPAIIDNPALGFRVPVIGTLGSEESTAELLLLDFAIFRSSVLKEIGPADEGLDWYGRGADMSIRCALLGKKMAPLQGVYLQHSLEAENRTPPHYAFDFSYLNQKWSHLERKGSPMVLVLDGGKVSLGTLLYARFLWPFVSALRRFVLRAL
jgi:glycosyltransferase involved in cell wall biosynthesis